MTEELNVRGGEGRNASTLELFFDLVYVFAITQVVRLIQEDATAIGFVITTHGLFIALSSPVMGSLIDRFGPQERSSRR